MAITEHMAPYYLVDGCDTRFATREAAQRYEVAKEVAGFIGKEIDTRFQSNQEVAERLLSTYIMIPRAKPDAEIMQDFRLATGSVADNTCLDLMEYLRDAN